MLMLLHQQFEMKLYFDHIETLKMMIQHLNHPVMTTQISKLSLTQHIC